MRVLVVGFLWVTLSILVACADRELRGTTSPSPDGETYLVVIDDGAVCDALEIDGVAWPYDLDRPGKIAAGRHEIGCGGESLISFEIEEGVVFEFDYWGP